MFLYDLVSSAEDQEYQFELNGILNSTDVDRARVFACFCFSEGVVLTSTRPEGNLEPAPMRS